MVRLTSMFKRLDFDRISQIGLFLIVCLFLLSALKPEFILSDVIPTGGDMASHYYSAVYLKDHLLPQGRIMGWQPGNYGGFPLFQFYFPLPFLIMVLFSLIIPMTVAFKIVCLAGVFGLPFGAYAMLKTLGFKKPGPELGAAFILPFLFMESTSMWGGNILSVMAGEFTYSIALTLALIYLGSFYRGVRTGRGVVVNALLLSLVGLSHGYTLIFCVAGVSFFLITTRLFLFRLIYILKVNLLAFCFMGFWIVPLLLFMPYTVPYNLAWVISSPLQFVPVIIWPFAGLGLVGIFFFSVSKSAPPETRTGAHFLLYLIALAAVLYLIGPRIGLVDIRFIPPAQVLLILPGAALAGYILRPLRLNSTAALALALLTVAWTARFETMAGRWLEWNYTGYETKWLWPAFREVNDYLRGDFTDSRVVYEHANLTGEVGSIRAFENLPLFSGRATLEGLYMQSSLSSPFVFYIQSEISEICSAPLANYNYSRLDLDRALDHLKLFNVGQYITVTDEVRQKALDNPGLELIKTCPPFTVFRVTENQGRYVTQPEYAPALILSKTPLAPAFAWFRFSDLKTPLVLAPKADAGDKSLFAAILDPDELPTWITDLPRKTLPPAPALEETVKPDEIVIQGAVPGRPLWIKVSYHPNWKVDGAARVWRASPSFMLVFPSKPDVRLYFGRTWPDYLGLILSCFGLLWAVLIIAAGTGGPSPDFATFLDRPLAPLTRIVQPRARPVLGGVLGLISGSTLIFILAVHHQDPHIYFNRGLKYYQAQDYGRARLILTEAAGRFPLSPVVDQTLHHLALSYYQEGMYEEAIKVWRRFPVEYPESRVLAETLYHIGLCRLGMSQTDEAREAFNQVTEKAPDSFWAAEAGRRLDELNGERP